MPHRIRAGCTIAMATSAQFLWFSRTIFRRSRRAERMGLAVLRAVARRDKRMSKPRVLFLCTGNSARSQMAEGYLRHVAGDRFEVLSAGIEPKGLNPFAVEAMRELGIDLFQKTQKDVKSFLGQQ